MKLTVKYFFLADFHFCGLSQIWINIFSLGRHVFWGGHLILESSRIQVNTVIMNPLSASYSKRCSVMHQLRKSKLNEKHLLIMVNFICSIFVNSEIFIPMK